MEDDSAMEVDQENGEDSDDDDGAPTTMGSMLNFFAEQALYRGIEAVDKGDYTGSQSK
jgi:hypothetical protein